MSESSATATSDAKSARLPQRAETIIIGGGIVGCSIAYHLTKLGRRDVLVLERHQLTAGTTWHAAGLVAQLRATENLTKLSRYSLDLYRTLEDETGQATGFKAPGAFSIASTVGRWEELRRTAAMARRLGVDAVEVGPAEISTATPGVVVDDIVGGIWLPDDAVVGPGDTTMALAKGARMGGATILEGTGVDRLHVVDGRVAGVITEAGETIEADNVVLAAGLWTRHLAAKHNLHVPLMAAEHHYVVTEPVDGIDADMPVLRDPDRWAYYKAEAGGALLVGLFEPVSRPWPAEGPPPTDKAFITMDPDPDHLGRWIEPAFDRMPKLHEAGLRLLFDGPESFTPDDSYIIGPTASLPGCWIASGFNSIGIQSAGGAGMALAQWMVDGHAPMDLHDVDIARFERFQATERYVRERTVEGLGLLYAPHWPHRQYETARPVRRSPLHDRLEAAGACFGETAGWERPMFYADAELGVEATYRYSWGRQNWHAANEAEHTAVRERVGIFDLTSFTKFSVAGPGAAAALNYMSTANVASGPGTSTYTQWCDDRGGIEADLTVNQISADEFWVIGGASTREHDLNQLRAAVAASPDTVVVTDITSAYAVLGVMGPDSRELLAGLTQADLSDEAFPAATNQEIDLGSALVRANRMSYVGELGWELYVPSEFAVHVFDAVWTAAAAFDGRLCGYHALNSLRFEKGYRHWGHDISPDETPLESGLGFTIDWDKPAGFRGKEALAAQKAAGLTKRLVQVALDDPDVLLHHNEPILRNGEIVGYVTDAMWGHTVGASVGMGWASSHEPIKPAWVNEAEWSVELPGGPRPVRVQLRPWL